MTEFYFDGGCKPNPGIMEIAVVAPSIGLKFHERLVHGTNNQAEWLALLMTLQLAQNRGLDEITAFGDSKLVVSQANGVWQCRQPELQVFLNDYREVRKSFKKVWLLYVPREKNIAGHHIESVN